MDNVNAANQTRLKASRTQRDPEKIIMSETVEAWTAEGWVLFLAHQDSMLHQCNAETYSMIALVWVARAQPSNSPCS